MKRKWLVLSVSMILGMSAFALSACGDDKVDDKKKLMHVPAAEATCTETGNIEYWTDGNKYFSDGAGKTEISLDDIIIDMVAHTPSAQWVTTDDSKHWHNCSVCGDPADEKQDHTFVFVVDAEPTLDAAGSKHEECSVCHKRKEPVAIAKIQYVAANPATCTGAGNIAYWIKDGKYYDDASCSSDHEIEQADTVDPQKSHTLSGDWISDGHGNHYHVCANGDHSAGDEQACTAGAARGSDGEKHWHLCAACSGKVPSTESAHNAAQSLEYTSTATGHFKVCECGEVVVAETEHEWEYSPTDNGAKHSKTCSVCGYDGGEENCTQGSSYVFHTDGRYHYICADCGNACDEITGIDYGYSVDIDNVTYNASNCNTQGDGLVSFDPVDKIFVVNITGDRVATDELKIHLNGGQYSVRVNVAENATAASVAVTTWGAMTDEYVAFGGAGTLTVNGEFKSDAPVNEFGGNLKVKGDVGIKAGCELIVSDGTTDIYGLLTVGKLTVGDAENKARPRLNIRPDSGNAVTNNGLNVFGVGDVVADYKVLSGTVAMQFGGERNGSAIDISGAGGAVVVGADATLTVKNFINGMYSANSSNRGALAINGGTARFDVTNGVFQANIVVESGVLDITAGNGISNGELTVKGGVVQVNAASRGVQNGALNIEGGKTTVFGTDGVGGTDVNLGGGELDIGSTDWGVNGGSVNAAGGTLVIAKRGGHGFAAFNNGGAIEIASEATLAIFDYDFIVYRDDGSANPSGTIAADITVENVPNRVADGLNVTVTGSVSDGDVKDVAIDIPEIPDIPAAA